MTIVVDASCMAAVLVDGQAHGRWSAQVLAADDLAAPELVLVETASVLRRLERSKHITRFEATVAHRQLLRANIAMFPYEALAPRVWELRGNITTYDATYVALAESLGAQLVTLDRKLERAASAWCEFLTPP